jgi:hypothetical protein
MSKEMIELADWLRHMRSIHETSICYQDPAIVEIIKKLRSWEDEVRASLPAPEAAPTREEIADPSIVQEVVAAFEHLRKKMRGDTKGEELAAFARVDRAILAIKAAPAK